MNNHSEPKHRKSLTKRILRWGVLLLLGFYVGFCVWFYFFQETVLLKPNTDPTDYVPKPLLTPSVDTFLASGEAKINVQKFDTLTDPPKGIVFYLHGNRGNMDLCRWEIEPFLNAGYDVWTMDYRGFGKSTGPLSEAALLADAQMVYKHILDQEKIDEKNVIVWGRSFGTGIAAFVASANSPKMLVLETPYYSIPDTACRSRPYLLPFLFRYHLPTHEYLRHIDCPVRLIHGTNDEKIDFQSSQRLEKCGLERKMDIRLHPIQDGRHNLRPEPDFEEVLKDILE